MGDGLSVRVLDGAGLRLLGAEDLGTIGEARCVWVDISEPDPGDLDLVGRRFGLHPLALEDCLHVPQRPKIEVFDDHLFVIWTTPRPSGQGADPTEVDAFLGDGWIVTIHLRSLVRERDFVSPDAFRYFGDIGDHLARVEDELDGLRTIATDLTDIHLSAVGNRTNEIMKRLTVVATIFMPLTLITGIYGMNFRTFPELGWRFGYPGVVALMMAVAVSMLVYFRRRGWW